MAQHSKILTKTTNILLAASVIITVGCGNSQSNNPDEITSDSFDAVTDTNPGADSSVDSATGADVLDVFDAEDKDVVVDVPGDTGPELNPGPRQADCRPNDKPFPTRPEPSEPATLPFLHVEGRDVVDSEGNKVMLRGINFGSWLMMESWIAGIGLLGQEELLAMMPEKADELGLKAFLEEAQGTNILDCSFELKPAWICAQEWRTYMESNATAENAAVVDSFWAWFDSEPWVFEERSLWNWFTKRFGYEKMQELKTTFQDNYITETDVEKVAALGLNLIRLPVWYQALETDIEGDNGFVEDGWKRLDEVIGWARKHKVYIMLDLHGAPGGQSPWWHQGLENGGQLWTRQDCIDKTARLWKAMAQYFKDEPHVAVYDLLNEPFGSPDRDRYVAVHDAIITAIREVDTTHIVMMEDGFINPVAIAGPAEMGWTNAMISFHDYPGGESAAEHVQMMEEEITKLEKTWARFDCPLFYGEFNVYGPNSFNATDDPQNRWQADAMEGVLDMMNRRGVHWAPWSWKYFASPSLWGVYYPAENPGSRLDVKDPGFEEIRSAFEKLHTDYFELDERYGSILSTMSAAAYAPLDLAE